MKESLALSYRPKRLEDVVEQKITTEILNKTLQSESFGHCFLFAGPSGTGKTTLSRIVANMINHGEGEPIEIDCASNSGVDNVRLLIESAYERSLNSKYKVIILDECHAITSQGWQAFLKTLEEPPLYTVFIFCTTEVQKIPATILNRLQRYNISKISTTGIYNRLCYICKQEGFINYLDTCDLISKLSNGSMRDALTYLDQCVDLSTDLNINKTKQLLGDISYEVMLKLTTFLRKFDEAKIIAVIESLDSTGTDLKQFINLYLDFMLDITKYFIFGAIEATSLPTYLLNNPDPAINLRAVVYEINDLSWLNLLIDKLLELKCLIKLDSDVKSTIEAYLIRFCRVGR